MVFIPFYPKTGKKRKGARQNKSFFSKVPVTFLKKLPVFICPLHSPRYASFSLFMYDYSFASVLSSSISHRLVLTKNGQNTLCEFYPFFFLIKNYRLLIAVTRASMDARIISGSTPAPHAMVPSGFLIPTYAIALELELRSSACS